MKMKTTTPTPILCPDHIFRERVAYSRTSSINGFIYDKVTGEQYGLYILEEYSPSPLFAEPDDTLHIIASWDIDEDGSPIPERIAPPPSAHLAEVVELFPEQPPQQVEQKTNAGRKPQAIENHLAGALTVLMLEERTALWLDDFTFGAICTGPGVINGKHSVSQADVKKLLRLPVLSVSAAAGCLLNHDTKPMSLRQLQRVVEAARVALRGIALHLERHPAILRSVDQVVDFDKFWTVEEKPVMPKPVLEHPMKQRALEMIGAKVPNKTIARELGIARNTIKKWVQAQALAGLTVEGVNDR
ncbi:helix-turn-helix domain-containing protein [Pseudomonas sp. PB101]|uniref:helix-turn-helix domain-containing protein n=1 Tax=Pseudomonas sp. PB101 TaxID=2495428 RepID=UPI00136590B3|nr:helix-turn-helix domain-containing protein [Pseudomonas sp. PB101]MVW87734.1 helix-turn-helix domain-containing protein [Pseudomonas sp. PB101]